MAPGYSISGIGYPTSGLGTYGLGSGGSFSAYDNYMPSMMGMNGSVFGGTDAYSMGTMGMMGGMYNPMFMAQIQNQMEEGRLQHAGNMHTAVLNNEITAHRETDSALIQKILTNGDIQQGVQNLYNKVKEGDQDGICTEFDKLKNYIYTTYQTELSSRGSKINPAVAATQIIEAVYGNIITAQTGQTSDLRSDIKRYGDGAMMNGFMKGFRRDHHDRYIDETLNHCFGLEIDQKGAKDVRQTAGTWIGRSASAVEKGLWGAGAGVAAATAGTLLYKGFAPKFAKNWLAECKIFENSSALKTIGKAGKWGFLIGMAADIIWQYSNSNT